MAPGGAPGAGAQLPCAGGRRGAYGRGRPDAGRVRHAVHDLPYGIGRRRHHGQTGREPCRNGDIPCHHQCIGYFPYSAGDSAGESIRHAGVLGLCGAHCLESIPGAYPAGTPGLDHPLYYAPAAARAHALGFQLVLCVGDRPHAGHGALHTGAAAERPWRLGVRRHRAGIGRHLLRAVLAGPPHGTGAGGPRGAIGP